MSAVRRLRLVGSTAVKSGRTTPAQTGLLIVGHGAGAEWNAGVRRVVERVRWPNGPVAVAFLMGRDAENAGWDPAVRQLTDAGSREIVVVPLLVSSHGAPYRQVLSYAGRLGSGRGAVSAEPTPPTLVPLPVPVRITPALDDAPELRDSVLSRWRKLDQRDRRRPVVLVAHGPNDPDDASRWLANLTRVAAALDRDGLRPPARVGLIKDDAPAPVRAAAVGDIRDTVLALAARTGDSVVVLPVLISTGAIDRVKLPRDLAELPIRYFPAPLAPVPLIARWIERSARRALQGDH